MTTFRQLVDKVRAAGLPREVRPRKHADVAKSGGVSLQYLYNLYNGKVKRPPDHLLASMAKGWKLPEKTIAAAIAESAKTPKKPTRRLPKKVVAKVAKIVTAIAKPKAKAKRIETKDFGPAGRKSVVVKAKPKAAKSKMHADEAHYADLHAKRLGAKSKPEAKPVEKPLGAPAGGTQFANLLD